MWHSYPRWGDEATNSSAGYERDVTCARGLAPRGAKNQVRHLTLGRSVADILEIRLDILWNSRLASVMVLAEHPVLVFVEDRDRLIDFGKTHVAEVDAYSVKPHVPKIDALRTVALINMCALPSNTETNPSIVQTS